MRSKDKENEIPRLIRFIIREQRRVAQSEKLQWSDVDKLYEKYAWFPAELYTSRRHLAVNNV